MKVLIDMNLSPRWVQWLSEAGIEADHWFTLGAPDATDNTILSFAKKGRYVVLTCDLDFGAILAVNRHEKPSVVQIRSDDVNPDVIGKSVVNALLAMKSELEKGALLTIDANRQRLRLLPLLS